MCNESHQFCMDNTHSIVGQSVQCNIINREHIRYGLQITLSLTNIGRANSHCSLRMHRREIFADGQSQDSIYALTYTPPRYRGYSIRSRYACGCLDDSLGWNFILMYDVSPRNPSPEHKQNEIMKEQTKIFHEKRYRLRKNNILLIFQHYLTSISMVHIK